VLPRVKAPSPLRSAGAVQEMPEAVSKMSNLKGLEWLNSPICHFDRTRPCDGENSNGSCKMKNFASRILCLLFLLTISAHADPRADQLINNYLNQSARRDAILSMNVAYQEAGKPAVRLEFTWMRKLKQGLASHLLRIDSPPSEKGKLLLVQEKPNGDADYLAYRPNSALKKKARISGARNYKYKGLTISVQELIGGELGKYDHESKGEATIDGVACHIVENRLRSMFKNDSDYPRSVCYLRKDNGMLQKWELFGKSNQLDKVITAGDMKQIEGHWTVTLANVDDLKRKGKSK
jgi:hypothetical protein